MLNPHSTQMLHNITGHIRRVYQLILKIDLKEGELVSKHHVDNKIFHTNNNRPGRKIKYYENLQHKNYCDLYPYRQGYSLLLLQNLITSY